MESTLIELGQVGIGKNLIVLSSDQILIKLALAKFGQVGPSQTFGQTRSSRSQPIFDRIRPNKSKRNFGPSRHQLKYV